MASGVNPQFSISNSTGDITGQYANRLIFVRVIDEREFKNSRFEIQVDNRDGLFQMPTIDLDGVGSTTIMMGYDGNLSNMGLYAVDECVVYGPPATITIIGHGISMGSDIKAPRQRSWHNQSLSDIVSAIAGAYGLSANVSGDNASTKIDHIDQTQSDMGFLTDLARNYNSTFKVMNGTLYFSQNGQQQGDNYILDCTEDTHYEYTYHTRGYYPGGVVARYADKAGGQEKIAATGNPQAGNYHPLNEVFPDQPTAMGAAQSHAAKLAGSADTLNLTMPGAPLLMSAVNVSLTNFPPQVPTDGWIADRVEHEIKGGGGYVTIAACISAGTDPSSTNAPGAGNQGGGGGGGGGSDTEPQDNKDGGDDGHTVTEQVDT